MAARLNVLLISNLFPTPVDPIRGVFTCQLAKRLKAICDVTVVCPLPWFPSWARGKMFEKWAEFSRVPGLYEWQGFTVHSPKYPMIPRMSEAAHAALMFPSLYRTVKRLHRLRRFDVVNTHWLYPDGVAAAWCAQLLGLPHVVTALGCDANLFMTQGHKRFQIERAIRKAEGVTVVSEALRQFLVEQGFGDKPIDVIPNGVDAELFRPRDKAECARQLGIVSRGKTVVFVGQLLEVKGIIYLIEAVERLVAGGKDVFVYMVGEGSGRPVYEAEVARRGLSGRIQFVGNRPHSEIAVWMGAGDVFCLPSIREGFPNVVLEALFSGRPVVASRVGGIPEMVNTNNGYLVESGNAAALADALGEALEKTWDANAILATVSHLSWERAGQHYLLSLEAAMKKRGGNP
ncbi:glycosyltransferase [Sulfuricaulis limicola]|uniref:Glycosyltransferase n=1 Tax=Sulfuricaulis limicola TaxID=1620215 RepID=A0A1B4XGW2_9GAMM|nr:glycosyltransferase family 4 protein [Sulfuricaulis limicola]BAV34013.1 glycosyltransferase [Sulfuricaulis limicola]